MKDKSKIILVVVILLVAAVIVRVCYGIKEGKKNPIVTMQVAYHDADGNEKTGTIKMELYPDVAPESVANFIALANNGFYDGLTFHRIIDNFMIQGGDPNGDGTGGTDYCIKGEFKANGIENTLKHEDGVLSMARSNSYNSAGSQFFIMNSTATYLDGNYAAFGKVIEGMDIVYKISKVSTDANDKPLEDVIIESITIDTKGIKYDEPIKIN